MLLGAFDEAEEAGGELVPPESGNDALFLNRGTVGLASPGRVGRSPTAVQWLWHPSSS